MLILGSGLGAAFAVGIVNPLFFGTPITASTVTVSSPTPFTLAWTTQPPTTATLGGRTDASFTVSNTNGRDISDYALYLNITGTGITPTCVSAFNCVTIYELVVSSSGFPHGMDDCVGGPCPTPNATPQQDFFLPTTVPAGTTLITLIINYHYTGTFVIHTAFIFFPSS